jgi:dTDP-D-glucose 4,6-dehydratase
MKFKTDKVKQVAEMIEKANAESEEGTFVSSRDMDELNYALQSKENLGHTHSYGNRPWKLALKSTADSYGKKENMMSYLNTRYKNKCKTVADDFLCSSNMDHKNSSQPIPNILKAKV